MTPDRPAKESSPLLAVAHIVGDFSRQPIGMKTIIKINKSSEQDSEKDNFQKDILGLDP